MNYESDFLEKVRAFGILGYPSHEILYLVDPEDPEQFVRDLEDPESKVYQFYHKGKATGRYTMDKALFDSAKANNTEANEKLIQRQRIKRIDTAIHEKFNL